MCDCTVKVAKTLENETKYEGKKVTKAKIKIQFRLKGSDLDVRTYSLAEIEVEGLKTPKTIQLTHTFCPFCGVKYPN